MSSWDYPSVIIAAVFVAVAATFWLMRLASGRRPTPDFECKVCGRRAASIYAKEWRYCPYCGVPKGSSSTKDLPNRPPRWALEDEDEAKAARRR